MACRPSPPGHTDGFTLIEMMIAITIGLGVIAGLIGVLAATAAHSRSNGRSSELMGAGRYALNVMKQDLRQAGFRGYTRAEPAATAPMAIGDECLESGAAAGSFVANLRQAIWGANDANPFSSNCIPATSYATLNDIVVLRSLAGNALAAGVALDADTVYFRSSYAGGQLFRGTQAACTEAPAASAAPPFNLAPCMAATPFTDLNDFALQIHVYYVSPFTVSASEVPRVPALFRVSLRSDGTMARELVASGIEHMQLQYGRLSSAGDTQYLDAGALSGSSFEPASTAWDDVHSVRLWLLARSESPEPGYSNTSSYAMGDRVYAVADGYRRRLFSTVVQLRN